MNESSFLKQIYASFQKDEQYQRMLFEQAPIGHVLCRMNGELVAANPAFARILGRCVEETLTISYWNLTPVKYTAEERHFFQHLGQTDSYGPFEKEYVHKGGYLVPVRVSGVILYQEGESFIWSSVEDLTEVKQAEKKLKEKNIAFKEVLSQIEFEKQKIKYQIMGNIDRLVLPILRKIKKRVKTCEHQYFEFIEKNLLDMTASFGLKISQERLGLTPMEIEICNLIKNGFRTKDIAQLLKISPLTVETHRHRVRKKLGIRNKSINLVTYLQSL